MSNRTTLLDSYERGLRVEQVDRRCMIDLLYPSCRDNVNEVELGLEDVRAADSILIRYDFDRDGWSILQASVFSWDVNDKEYDSGWQEVAFIQAWAREKGAENV